MSEQVRYGNRTQERLARQCAKFDISVRQGRADTRKDKDLNAQSRRYAEAASAIRAKEMLTRQVLMRYGVFSSQFMPYLRFVRFLSRTSKETRGAAFEVEAEAAVARWTGLGCSRDWLAEIVLAVFNLRLETDRLEPLMNTDGHRLGSEPTGPGMQLGLAKEPEGGVELDGSGGQEGGRQNEGTR